MPKNNCNHDTCSNIFAVMLLLFAQVQSNTVHYDEICGNFDGRRMYIELGKKGVITASSKNINVESIDKKINSYKQCSLELISCSSCIISLRFIYLNISKNCNKNPLPKTCNCDYVWIYEPPFENISGQQFCGHYSNKSNSSVLFYRSKTRTVTVTFFYSQSYEHAFILHYSSERNRQFLEGFPKNNSASKIISTPFFPHPYSRDLNVEYVIRCSNNQENCRICLIFTDFLIAKMSVIEFFEWSGKRLGVSTGLTFRPPIVISSGPALNIRFYANGATNKGFKASYTFLLTNTSKKTVTKQKMNCGGLVDNLGGTITMMNMVKESRQSFDCVWILQPSRNFLHFYTHVYLKVVAFSDFAEDTELSIHEGPTSSGVTKENFRYPSNLVTPRQKEYILLITEGFYVRFKGILSAESKLAIAYTAFTYNDCIPGSDFLCKNQHCIPLYLQCDGFDHCGDNSDEPTSCFQDSKNPRWSHNSNFFFPKTVQYSNLHAAAIVFLVCCFGMISLIFALIVLIFRINGRARQQREIENHLEVVRDLLDLGTPDVEGEIRVDDPPVYEAPPNYDEISKGKSDISDKPRRSRRRSSFRNGGGGNRSSLRRGTCSRCSKRLNPSESQNARRARGEEENLNISGGASQVAD